MIMAARRVSAPTLDLLAWPAVADARGRLAAALDDQAVAERRLRCAPHGEITNRRRAFQEAVHEVLRAQIALAAVVGESVH
jgi:hypothetical protein